MDKFFEKRKEIEKSLEEIKYKTKAELYTIIESIVSLNYEQIDKYNINEKFDQIVAQVNMEVKKRLIENTQEVLNDFNKALTKFYFNIDTSSFQIKDKVKVIEYDTSSVAGKVGEVIGGVLGGVIGSVLPGEGTFIGALLGSGLGEKIGKLFGEKKREEIVVGDNKDEVMTRFKNTLLEKEKIFIENFYQSLEDDFFKRVDGVVVTTQKYLNNFKREVIDVYENI